MNKEYYYFYKDEQCKNINFDEKGQILFIQYKAKKENEKETECCGIAFGTYEKKEINTSNNKLLQVKELEKINFNQGNINKEKENINIEESEAYKYIVNNILKNNDRYMFNFHSRGLNPSSLDGISF